MMFSRAARAIVFQSPVRSARCSLIRGLNASAASEEAEMSMGLLEGTATQSMGSILRHGSGDACITLNVGGKEFMTLRSTVAANPVLADHVARAEANQEIITSSGAVFIDRDPTHFPIILQYLRNRVEIECSVAQSNTTRLLQSAGWSNSHLPSFEKKDPAFLSELFVEATYYRIPALQQALQDATLLMRLLSIARGGNISGATRLLTQLRNIMFAVGGLAGTITVGSSQDQISEIFTVLLGSGKPESK